MNNINKLSLEPYYQGSVENLKKILKAKLSDYRYEHSLRVLSYALELNRIYKVDEKKLIISSLLHDYAKEISDENFAKKIENHPEIEKDIIKWKNPIMHGIVGAEFVKDDLSIKDEEILNSIRKHTTGDKNMNNLDKIVFISDFLEEKRNFENIALYRKISKIDLDLSVSMQLSFSIKNLIDRQQKIYPLTFESYNYWVNK